MAELASHNGVLVQVLAALLASQSLDNVPGKAMYMAQFFGSLTHALEN